MTYPTKDSFVFDHTLQGDYPAWTPAETKANLNARSEEMRVALNALIGALNSTGEDNWLYQQIANVVLNQVVDGSLTDVKLSDLAGQIKDRVALHHANTSNPHAVTADQTGAIPVTQKGVAGGVATYDGVLGAVVYTTNTPVLKTTILAADPNFIPLLAPSTWGTIYTYSFTKLKGQKFIGLSQDSESPYLLGSYVYNTSTTYDSSGMGGTPGTRVYVNNVLKTEFITSGDLLIDISSLADGSTITIRIDVYNNQETATSWNWYQQTKIKLNDIFKIAY